MNEFIRNSIIASIILTVLINLFPAIFPKSAERLHRKLEQQSQRAIEQNQDPNRPNIKIFFPWKAMILISIGLTILVNLEHDTLD